jgi:CheY-like chemotaxis protein
MTVKTCLLVSDDPDDHQSFSEVSSEISAGAVVLIILDSQKAIHFVKTTTQRLDCIFLDLSMQGIRVNSFLKIVREDPELRSSKIIVYGEEPDFIKIGDPKGLIFFKKDYDYPELKDFLKNFMCHDAQD